MGTKITKITIVNPDKIGNWVGFAEIEAGDENQSWGCIPCAIHSSGSVDPTDYHIAEVPTVNGNNNVWIAIPTND